MITIPTDLTSILLFGLLVGIGATFLLNNLSKYYKIAKEVVDNNRQFARKQAAVDEMKSRGEMHEWATVATPNGDIMVCKKTGWSPDLKGFVPVEAVTSYLNKIKVEEEYKEYRNKRVEELAKEIGLSLDKTEEIVEKVFSIKKDFHVDRISKLSNELGKRAEDVRKEQN